MYRNSITILFLCGLFLAATGCKKFLQVQPVGAYTETQVFASKKAAEQALNGVYIKLAANELYGSALTQTYIELMAQQYRTFLNTEYYYDQYRNYDYAQNHPRGTFEAVWGSAYSTILSANLFLQKIDVSIQNNVLSEQQGKLLKGEAIAIRAMLHFDMLRIFGPIYSTGSAQLSIPYYTLANAETQPFISAAEVINKVITDLDNAEQLLVNDAVLTEGVVQEADFYTGHRNQRLNYFAVKALKARVHLWAGNKLKARDEALAVVAESEKWFPWLSEEAIKNTDYPDRIFSTEVLFAVHTREMYNNFAEYFSPLLTDAYLLTPQITNLRAVFENNENDYRFSSTWRAIPGKTVRSFYKFENASVVQRWGFLQPMIRKSELYYILAETENDPVQAIAYLNAVRTHRGLANLPGNALIPGEIQKEYKKEFYGEGQLFFYYKRTNTPSIPDGQDGTPRLPVYQVPLPLSETTTR